MLLNIYENSCLLIEVIQAISDWSQISEAWKLNIERENEDVAFK